MIASLKWVLRMTQKSHLSSLGCLFSHSAEWPGHTSSHSSNAVPHLLSLSALSCAFITWHRRSRLITRHSIIASALTCHLTCLSTCMLCLLTCCIVRNVSAVLKAAHHPLCPASHSLQSSGEPCSCICPAVLTFLSYIIILSLLTGLDASVYRHTLISSILARIFIYVTLPQSLIPLFPFKQNDWKNLL